MPIQRGCTAKSKNSLQNRPTYAWEELNFWGSVWLYQLAYQTKGAETKYCDDQFSPRISFITTDTVGTKWNDLIYVLMLSILCHTQFLCTSKGRCVPPRIPGELVHSSIVFDYLSNDVSKGIIPKFSERHVLIFCPNTFGESAKTGREST